MLNHTPQNPQLTAYYWRQGFMLLAPSFLLDRSNKPYRRLSATLMLALRNPFTLQTGDGEQVQAHAALIAPTVLRRCISAIDSDIAICDMAVFTPEYRALAPLLDGESVRVLNAELFAPLRADFGNAQRGELSAAALQELLHKTIFTLTGCQPQPAVLHPRIDQVLKLIDEQPMSAVTLPWLAQQVHLSPSRLRHLFKEQCGSSLTHYLRWNAVWKGIWLWSKGQPLVRVAEAAGFHDLAHLNRAFNEVFGLNPSTFFQSDQVRLIRCDRDRAAATDID